MTRKNQRRLKTVLNYILGWSLAFVFLGIVRGEGTQELGSVQFDLKETLRAVLFMGPFFGSISGIAHLLFQKYFYKRMSFRTLFFVRDFFSFLFVTGMVSLAYVLYGNGIGFWTFAFEPGSFAIYFYIITVDIILFTIWQIDLFMGAGNLWKLLRGKFYAPQEEERIFMFLDLQSSTSYAEQLGHIEYSQFIQDCFNDLGVVLENEAEIYQYVGDEVVLSWEKEIGIKNQNCLNAFFSFQDRLMKKEKYYLDQYNCKPIFKAGANVGLVTVTEVGKYKKEIAYHGDTINTAARIRSICNEYNQSFLISENLKNELRTENFVVDEIGEIHLKGKQRQVTIHSIQRPKSKNPTPVKSNV